MLRFGRDTRHRLLFSLIAIDFNVVNIMKYNSGMLIGIMIRKIELLIHPYFGFVVT